MCRTHAKAYRVTAIGLPIVERYMHVMTICGKSATRGTRAQNNVNRSHTRIARHHSGRGSGRMLQRKCTQKLAALPHLH